MVLASLEMVMVVLAVPGESMQLAVEELVLLPLLVLMELPVDMVAVMEEEAVAQRLLGSQDWMVEPLVVGAVVDTART